MSSPWTRRRDKVIAAVIAVAVVGAGLLVWVTSDSAATDSSTARPPAHTLEAPDDVPETLTEAWRARSAASPEPVGEGATVVTGNDGTVTGHDALTGERRWHYRRDLELCTVGQAWASALAVYRNGSGCSEVTKLDPGTGRRTGQRNGDAQLGTRLLKDDSHVVTTGKTLLNVWSQDLIRVMEYGDVPAPVNPGKQPRPGCAYGSTATASGKIAVIERCGRGKERLTVLNTTHHDDGESKSDEPDVLFSQELPGKGARAIAIGGGKDFRAAVAIESTKQLMVYGQKGKLRAQYALELPADDLSGDPEGGSVTTSRTASDVYWFTGSATIALDESDLAPRWTLRGTLGPVAMFAGKMLMPIAGGLAVIDEDTGKAQRTIRVDRGDYAGLVQLGSVGPVLLEQRADTLVALR